MNRRRCFVGGAGALARHTKQPEGFFIKTDLEVRLCIFKAFLNSLIWDFNLESNSGNDLRLTLRPCVLSPERKRLTITLSHHYPNSHIHTQALTRKPLVSLFNVIVLNYITWFYRNIFFILLNYQKKMLDLSEKTACARNKECA